MLVNLLQSFDSRSSSELLTSDFQTSFNFDKPPSVTFVKSIATLEPVDLYADLDSYHFTEDDQQKIAATRQQIEQNGGYDGDQLLIEDMVYDTEKNALYLVARRAKYSFIRTLQKSVENGGFDASSAFYKKTFCTAGVRVPFITEDAHTFFMMRTRPPRVYSVAAGLLEPPAGRLHPAESDNNLVSYVACMEVLEEFLGKPELSDAPLSEQLANARAMMRPSGIAAIAMRGEPGSPRVAVEFINPVRLNCTKEDLYRIIENNSAKDAHEHLPTGAVSVPLASYQRQQAEDIVAAMPVAGKYVLDPLLAVTSMIANRHSRFFPTVLPGRKTTEFFPVALYRTKIPGPLLTEANEPDMVASASSSNAMG